MPYTQIHSIMSTPNWPLDNSYARLPEAFYARVDPTPVAKPRLLRLNRALAEQLGLPIDYLESDEGVETLAGNRVLDEMDPIAMIYAGQQFGGWVPQLGDGRAILLGEVIDRDGVRRDIQLKGAGPTPFSRNGDGRAALGPVIREYIVSEGMAGLGIPTTRALAMVETGEPVYRERALPGAILTRVARGHIRVGTFQYFMSRGDTEAIRTLADHLIGRAFPTAANQANPYRGLLEEVIKRQADLIARWMGVGFIHGVMNTDNVSIVGETLDYGPCAFMDRYHPETVFSSIDHQGRYAYRAQPGIALWNLTRFSETLLPLLAPDQEESVEYAKEALAGFTPRFDASRGGEFRRKLGLLEATDTNDEMAVALLKTMAEQGADFTLTFRDLSNSEPARPETMSAVRARFDDPSAFDDWAKSWTRLLDTEARDPSDRRRDMRATNPAFIPRNHRVQQVIDAAEDGDLDPLDDLLEVVTQPFSDHAGLEHLAFAPEPNEVVQQTFCGT
jgi:uncharacterized protein YdiU (UPF0061 family)